MKNKMEHISIKELWYVLTFPLYLLLKKLANCRGGWKCVFCQIWSFFRWFSLRWTSQRIPLFSMTTSNTILLILWNIFRKLVNCKNYWIFVLLGGLNSSLKSLELILYKCMRYSCSDSAAILQKNSKLIIGYHFHRPLRSPD